jgi:hypothetical protein
MSLTPGTSLGPYHIVSALGAGGMGEVYRAKDMRLDRDVAIKVLPESFALDADRVARFTREAKAVAALSHPNIVNIFDTGVEQGRLFVVMELLDGETLRDRLAGGALTVRKTIDIAVQIARGLASAHDKALVHRDLKPENIFLLADGQVKILDFGLARQAPSANAGATETGAALTNPGSVMGTVGYMAPEQVRGQAADARTDLFAFGAVLYEMLSGQRAFQRDTSAETMTAILKEDPPELTGRRVEIPPALDRIIRHCLEKNPIERFQTARDVAFALTSLSGSQVSSGAAAAVSAPRRSIGATAVAALVLLAFAAGALAVRLLTPVDEPLRFETKTLDAQWITRARFGPDGETIIFSSSVNGNVPEVFVQRPGAMTPVAIGQKAAHLLGVSSKGELAVITNASSQHHFMFSGTLSRMTLEGAAKAWLENVSDADWSPDGATLAIVHSVDGHDLLEYPIGRVLYKAPAGYLSDPRVSPDGAAVAFFEHPLGRDNRGFVKLVSRDGTGHALGGEYWGEEGLAWSADGRRVYFSASRAGGEPYQPFDVNVSGPPVVRQSFSSPGAMLILDVSRTGRQLVMRHDRRWSMRVLVPGEPAEREAGWLDFAIWGVLSPDRKTLAFTDLSASAGANYATAMRDLATGKVVRLGEGFGFGFSGDGQWIGAQLPSTLEIVLYPVGAGETIRVPKSGLDQAQPPSWMPRSRRLLLCGVLKAARERCYTQDPTTGALTPLTPEGVGLAWFAPDERTYLTRGRAGAEVRTLASDRVISLPALTRADDPVAFSDDGRSVFVSAGSALPRKVDRIDIATNVRTTVRELAPPDRAGLTGLSVNYWIADGKGYVYQYQRALSTLFVVTGVK